MGKRLVITEKPSVARDIVGALGGFSERDGYWENDDFLVTYAVGHLFELPAPEDIDERYKRWTLDTLPILPEKFELKAKSDQKDRVSVLRKLLKRDDVDVLVNACDAGREGELIFREIAEYFGAPQPIERLWLQSMTKDAIAKGFRTLQDGRRFDGLSDAAYCRNYSDWLIGINATRALTKRLSTRTESSAWSAGRVQTPTLAMLADRELEILQHVPAPYWRVLAVFDHGENRYRGTWFDPAFKGAEDGQEEGAKDDRIFDEAKARAILDRIAGQPAVARETRKPSKEAAPPLFDLTSLQREANRRFGWTARRTLNAAQRCYEHYKVLTYPRTDTKALPSDYRAVVDEVLDQLSADDRFRSATAKLKKDGLLNTQKIFDDSKVTDHFAIVPTGTLVAIDPKDDAARIFDLVTRRFLAAFFPPAVWSRVERVTEVVGESFRSRARTLQVPGWREVLGDEANEEAERLPPLVDGKDEVEGVSVTLSESEVEADETKPPARISESRLLTLMESAGKNVDDDEAAEAMKDSGIGTPATRADIIENLITKGYIARVGRGLKASAKGIRLIEVLRRMRAERLASPALTGELEAHLGRVERGGSTRAAFMDEIYDYAKEIVDLTKTFEFEDLYPNEHPLGPCPCGKNKPVYERSLFYRCEEPEGFDWRVLRDKRKKGEETPEDCPFRIWKDKTGRYVDRRTVTELLEHKRSRPLDGFVDRNGRTFRGILELTSEGVELRPLEGGSSDEAVAETPEYEVDHTPLSPCPVCREGQIVETRSTFLCSNGLAVLKALDREETSTLPLKNKDVPEGMKYCPALLARTVCKREITRDEAIEYFRDGKTQVLEGFTSRKGRPFSAQLYLKEENGRVGFEFPTSRSGDGEGAKKRTSKKKASTKKKAVAKKKTAAKKKTGTKKKAPTKKKSAAKKKTAEKASASTANDKQASARKDGAAPGGAGGRRDGGEKRSSGEADGGESAEGNGKGSRESSASSPDSEASAANER